MPDIDTAAARLLPPIAAAAEKLAQDYRGGHAAAYHAILHRLSKLGPARSSDGRAAAWHCRLRLYDLAKSPTSPEADTDREVDDTNPGHTTLRGFGAISTWAASLIKDWHGRVPESLDTSDLRRRIENLRPTLSRRGGIVAARLTYTAPDGSAWLARIDICRAD
jgi:hypothetical protein